MCSFFKDIHGSHDVSFCRWRDVKLRAFENADHRTYVDLKVSYFIFSYIIQDPFSVLFEAFAQTTDMSGCHSKYIHELDLSLMIHICILVCSYQLYFTSSCKLVNNMISGYKFCA